MSSIAQPVARSVSRSVLAGQRMNLGYLIRSMFSNSEIGFAYDPNDLTTLYQDAAGTTPVTAAGQPVGLMLDKSGRGNHARQTTSASRPILRRNATTGAYYLEFDGSDDFLVTNSIDFTSTDKVSLFAGVRKLSDIDNGTVVELSASDTNNGMFFLRAPSGGLNNYQFISKGTSISDVALSGYAAPNSSIITAKSSISTPIAILRINSSNTYSNSVGQGSGNYGNYPLYIGRRGGATLPFNGHLYGLIGIGRLTTDSETIALEKSIAKNVGVTI